MGGLLTAEVSLQSLKMRRNILIGLLESASG